MSNQNPIDSDEVVIKLLSKGASPVTVANLLDLDLDYVLSFRVTRSNILPQSEAEIGTMAHRLAMRAYEEANRILDEGTPAMKIRLITSIQGHYLRQMNNQTPKAFDEMRSELESLLHYVGTDSSDSRSIYSNEPLEVDDAGS